MRAHSFWGDALWHGTARLSLGSRRRVSDSNARSRQMKGLAEDRENRIHRRPTASSRLLRGAAPASPSGNECQRERRNAARGAGIKRFPSLAGTPCYYLRFPDLREPLVSSRLAARSFRSRAYCRRFSSGALPHPFARFTGPEGMSGVTCLSPPASTGAARISLTARIGTATSGSTVR